MSTHNTSPAYGMQRRCALARACFRGASLRVVQQQMVGRKMLIRAGGGRMTPDAAGRPTSRCKHYVHRLGVVLFGACASSSQRATRAASRVDLHASVWR
jgi:hypothetical protein